MQETSDRRLAGRRHTDITREMLEESMKELPNFFVTVLDDEKGMYTFYYSSSKEARDMVASLEREGIEPTRIGIYKRDRS